MILEITPALLDIDRTRSALIDVMGELNLKWDYSFVSSPTRCITIAITEEAAAIFILADGGQLLRKHFLEMSDAQD